MNLLHVYPFDNLVLSFRVCRFHEANLYMTAIWWHCALYIAISASLQSVPNTTSSVKFPLRVKVACFQILSLSIHNLSLFILTLNLRPTRPTYHLCGLFHCERNIHKILIKWISFAVINRHMYLAHFIGMDYFTASEIVMKVFWNEYH